MNPPVGASSECASCHALLEPGGECLVCLLRGGLNSPDTATETAAPVTVFGDFEIMRRDDGSRWELGRGAMGVTYRAVDQVLHRQVALKVVNVPADALNLPAVRERFLREARAAAALRHANVAGIFQLGTSPEDGRCYCAMELVEGETLEARVRREGPLDAATVLDIGAQVARALTAAAARGLIHRDLKPGNLMLTGPDEIHGGLEVKVIDFGLVKAGLSASGQNDLTHGGFVGTPAFASPEQFAGGEVDARSDLYSLGATMWFALAGRVPFAGKTPEEGRAARANGVLPVEQLTARNVPAPLIDLLRATLANDPDQRPASARRLLGTLEDCRRQLGFGSWSPHDSNAVGSPLPGGGSNAMPGSASSSAGRGFPSTPRRHRALALTALLLAVAVAATLLLRRVPPATGSRPSEPALPTSGSPVPPVIERSIAVLPFRNLSADRENAYFTDGVQDEVLTDLARIADLRVISRTSVMQYRSDAPRNLREIARQLGVAYVLEGSVQRAGNTVRVTAELIDARTDTQQWAMHYDRPLGDVFAIQSEIAQAIADQLHARISPEERATIAHAPTTDVLAFEYYQQAKELEGRHSDPSSENGLRQAVDLLGKALDRDPQFFQAACLLTLTQLDLYWEGFDHTASRLELARLGVEQAHRLAPESGETHVAQAVFYYHGLSDYGRARQELTLARSMLPNNTDVSFYLAAIARREGRWDDAVHGFGQALELNPRDFLTLSEIAHTEEALEHDTEAARYYQRALEVAPGDVYTRERLALIPFFERGDLGPLHSLNASIEAHEPAALAEAAYFRLLGALAERDPTAANAALATFPAGGYQTGFTMPKEWFAGLTARTFGDETAARAAFTAGQIKADAITRARPNSAAAWSVLGWFDAGLGHKEEAVAAGRRACELLPISKDAYSSPDMVCALAMIYAWVGEKDLALQTLGLVIHARTGISSANRYGSLKYDPQWDPLRGDPRFEALVASLAPR